MESTESKLPPADRPESDRDVFAGDRVDYRTIATRETPTAITWRPGMVAEAYPDRLVIRLDDGGTVVLPRSSLAWRASDSRPVRTG